jgi:hypothetical protein
MVDWMTHLMLAGMMLAGMMLAGMMLAGMMLVGMMLAKVMMVVRETKAARTSVPGRMTIPPRAF